MPNFLGSAKLNQTRCFWHTSTKEVFFAKGSGKKHQFPDAFVFERLKEESSQNEPLIIVSRDKDFEQPVNDHIDISLVKSIPGLFSELGLVLEDPKIEEFLEQNHRVLIEMVNDELSNWPLEGDIEDSVITEADVADVEIQKIIAFKSAQNEGPNIGSGEVSCEDNCGFHTSGTEFRSRIF